MVKDKNVMSNVDLTDETILRVAKKVVELLDRQPAIKKDWFSTTEVAAMFGVDIRTVRNYWIKPGKMKASKDWNGRIKIHRDAIEEFANKTGKTLFC